MKLLSVRMAFGLMAVVGAAMPAGAQVDAGYLAAWNDRELRVAYLSETDETSATLALVPETSGVILVFEARWAGPTVDRVPTSVGLRSYPHPLAVPRIRHNLELRFAVQPENGPPLLLSYFGRSWGPYGFVPAGGEISVVRFDVSSVEIAAIAAGESVTGTAMGIDFALDRAEIEALQQFVRIVRAAEPVSP